MRSSLAARPPARPLLACRIGASLTVRTADAAHLTLGLDGMWGKPTLIRRAHEPLQVRVHLSTCGRFGSTGLPVAVALSSRLLAVLAPVFGALPPPCFGDSAMIIYLS